jgi:hypothetical protein
LPRQFSARSHFSECGHTDPLDTGSAAVPSLLSQKGIGMTISQEITRLQVLIPQIEDVYNHAIGCGECDPDRAAKAVDWLRRAGRAIAVFSIQVSGRPS